MGVDFMSECSTFVVKRNKSGNGLLKVPTCLGCWGWGTGCRIIICNKGVIDKKTHLIKVRHWQAYKTENRQANKATNYMQRIEDSMQLLDNMNDTQDVKG